MRSGITSGIFVFSQVFLNIRVFWVEYLRYLLMLFCLWWVGFFGFVGHHWILQYKEDIRQVTAMTFYLSPKMPNPVRDSFLLELRGREKVVDLDFVSSKQGGEDFAKYLGISDLKNYLDNDPLPSKVKVYFKPHLSLDVLKGFIDEVSAAPYVESAQFNAQDWIHFQDYLSLLGGVSPCVFFIVMMMTYLNAMYFFQRCFISSQWISVWKESGVSGGIIRLQILVTILLIMVCLWGLVKAFLGMIEVGSMSKLLLGDSFQGRYFYRGVYGSFWLQVVVGCAIVFFHPFVSRSLKNT
ncbi:MAG TPA: permease-like cell division protein FtsX [Gammaproteobacteria bacterium]|nr:permease-like cell division protein FtsX [Gammaproteobacteria bacterium]